MFFFYFLFFWFLRFDLFLASLFFCFLWCFLCLWFSWCFSECIWPFVVGVCKGCTVLVTPNCIWCVWEHVKHAKKHTPRVARSVWNTLTLRCPVPSNFPLFSILVFVAMV